MVEEKKVVIKFSKVEFEGDWVVAWSTAYALATYTLKTIPTGTASGTIIVFSKDGNARYPIIVNQSVVINNDVAHITYKSTETS